MGTKTQNPSFNEHDVLHDLKHYLPAQAPLKDFIHHNTLHAFQKLKFFEGLRSASEIFGYKVSLSLDDYRVLYHSGQIDEAMLEHLLILRKGNEAGVWRSHLISKAYENAALPRIGGLRSNWKRQYKMDLDSIVHPILFRIVCSYLDQGISIWNFPVKGKTFLAAIREMEQESFTSFFKRPRAKKLFLEGKCEIADLLKILVGDESLYERYLFDQQFAHQGWSGMVSTIEDQPSSLLDQRKLSTHDLVTFELLLEIDALDFHFTTWAPLAEKIKIRPSELFAPVVETEYHQVMRLWQEAFEWTYYDQVLAGMVLPKGPQKKIERKSFQSMFCIDDREISLRRYLESLDENCETFGTPGFFGAEFYFQPEDGKFFTKVCPQPVTPKFLIKEVGFN